MYLQFRMGADGMGPGQLGVFGRGVMNGLPVVVFLFTMNFPAVSNYSNIFISVSICMDTYYNYNLPNFRQFVIIGA